MSSYTVPDYYHRNLPRGKFLDDGFETWDNSSSTTLTIQPSADRCILVESLILRVSDNFAMTATDEITITYNAYGSSPYEVRTIDDATPITDICRLGDPELYEAKTFDGTNYHIVKIPYRPPVYLRESPSTAESLVLEYDDSGGGITAGTLYIDVWAWELAEDDSGITVG